jgi:hypothetical protein
VFRAASARRGLKRIAAMTEISIRERGKQAARRIRGKIYQLKSIEARALVPDAIPPRSGKPRPRQTSDRTIVRKNVQKFAPT